MDGDLIFQREFIHWDWRFDWKATTTVVVNTGMYYDDSKKRAGIWKVVRKISRDDHDRSVYLFEPYVANWNATSVTSCGDTSL